MYDNTCTVALARVIYAFMLYDEMMTLYDDVMMLDDDMLMLYDDVMMC